MITYLLWRNAPGHTTPAILVIEDDEDTRYTFNGGYGDDTIQITQPGCALIAQYMNSQDIRETPHNLTTILFQAKEWRDARTATR